MCVCAWEKISTASTEVKQATQMQAYKHAIIANAYVCLFICIYMRIYVWFYVALFVITGCHQAFHRHIQHQTNLLTSILTNSRTIHRQPYYRNIPISTKHKASTHSIPTIPFHSATQVKLMLQALLRPLPQQLPPPLLPCCC